MYILDADDLIDKTMIECGYWAMKTNPRATWSYANTVGFGTQKYLWNKKFDSEIQKKQNLLIVASFIRKEALLSFKEYENLEKGIYEDWYMWMNFLRNGYFPVRMNFYGFWYRRLENSMLSDIKKLKEKHKYAMSKINSISRTIRHRVEAVQFPINWGGFDYKKASTLYKWDNKLKYRDNKKNILLILPWAVVGGADKFNVDLISGIDKEKYRITVLTTEPCNYMWRQKLEKYAEYFDLTTFLRKGEWYAFINYIIKSRNIKLVCILNSMYGYQCVPLIKSDFPEIPVIDYLHNEDFSWNNGGYPFESTVISRLLDKSYTCTKYLKNLMIEKMNREVNNVEPVYIGTDAEHYNPLNTEITNLELMKQFKNKKVVFFPCRVTEQKRPMLMLEILNKIILKNKKIIFLVVGDGNMKPEVLKKTKKLNLENHIVFLPNQSDMRQFYKMADVTLICSMYEGLTLTTYESLAMGVPVITSDVGGQAELVDQTCGRVIKLLQDPKKDVRNFNYSEEEINSYVTAIQEVLNDKQLKQNCRKKILEKFTTKKMVEIFEKEFGYLTKNKSIIDPKICSNPELANRYLEKCYNTTDVYHIEEDSNLDYKNLNVIPLTLKEKIKYRYYRYKDELWKYKSWRTFMRFCQKSGIVKLKKKVFKLIRNKNHT